MAEKTQEQVAAERAKAAEKQKEEVQKTCVADMNRKKK